MGVARQVNQQVAQQAVYQPWRQRFFACQLFQRHLLKGDVQLVQIVVARLIDARRLTGGADKRAGKQIRQRGMILPIGNQAAQQIGTPQQRAVRRRCPAERDVVAAAGAGVTAVEHELFRAQARQPRGFVEREGVGCQFIPGRARMNVDFNHAGVGRDVQRADARIGWRAVAFEAYRDYRRTEFLRDLLQRGEQIEKILRALEWRQERMQASVAYFDAQGGAHHVARLGFFGCGLGVFRVAFFFGGGVRIVQVTAIIERIALELRLDLLRQPLG